MSQPVVTVVIPTYNRASLLKFAVESVMMQTYPHFELWVVGDHCTDNSEEIMAEFLVDDRVNWYNLPENSGYQSKPNNEGIKRGSGKYIAYLNHDDLWLPNHLEVLVNHLEESDADFAFGIMQWVYSFRESRPDVPLLPQMPRPPEATALMHKRDVIDKIGYWKDIHETYAYPRTQFFRDGYKQKLKFEQVPRLTAIKFLWDEKNYQDQGPQEIYLNRLKTEPDYAEAELAKMLMNVEREVSKPPTKWRMQRQWSDRIRTWFINWNLDPARIKFWQNKGKQIRIWRKRHGLKN